jgi:anthranilate phosphoribosyltransferase
MNEDTAENPAARMKGYLEKVATGPEMGKSLAEAEADDALTLILRGEISPIRSAIFLIATRMKRETLEENIGFWKALDRTTLKHNVNLDRLLQVADPFDGFERVPYFGFYAIPLISAMGLPAYGHSSLPLPPKFGITFESILYNHYQVPLDASLDKRARLIEDHQFGYLSTRQSHPPLESLRGLREEIVKRTTLSTFEKMLQPLKAKLNYLATGYFHKGYETPMLAAGKLSGFDTILAGNGTEGSTLYGAHKAGRLFIQTKTEVAETSIMGGDEVVSAYGELKKATPDIAELAEWGESALKNNHGPAATLIAWQAGTLCHLLGLHPSAQAAFDAAREILRQGTAYDKLMRYIDQCR